MVDSHDPAFGLVAACCRPGELTDRTDAIAQAASKPFDVDRLLNTARAHRVEALVEHGLALAGVTLPDAAAALLAARVRTARLQMLRNAGEEVRLSALFHDAAIDAIFVKGATLAMLAHQSLANKVSWDIDLLVARDAIDRAILVLRGAGYAFDHHDIVGDAMARRSALGMRETSWTHPERRTTVELHWALTNNPLLLRGIGIGSERQSVAVAEQLTVPTLTTPDLFAFLAVHGTAHGWSRLKWLADIAALAANQPHALPGLFHHAHRVNAGRCAGVALTLMHDILGVTIPSELSAQIANDRHVARLADYSTRSMLHMVDADDALNHSLLDWWEQHRVQMIMAPGLRHGVADIWAKLNQPNVPRRLRLPRWLLVPDALLIWLPMAFMRRVAAKLQSLRLGNSANSRKSPAVSQPTTATDADFTQT